jgi:hypothetical protein
MMVMGFFILCRFSYQVSKEDSPGCPFLSVHENRTVARVKKITGYIFILFD